MIGLPTRRIAMLGCAVRLLCASASIGAQALQYHLTDSISAGADNGDLYTLDVAHHRLYGAGRNVVDVVGKRVALTVADTTAGGGFVVAPELGRGVVRNGTVFDLSTGYVIRRLPAMGDASLYDPLTSRAFLLGDSVSVIDLKAASIVRKISVPGAGESGVSDARGRIYLNLNRANAIAVLDARSLRVIDTYSIAPAKAPMGLSIDVVHRRLFAACDSQVVVVNADNGHVVATVPVPGHTDESAFDPGTGLLFEPGGRGKGLTIIHQDSPDHYSVVQTLSDSLVRSLRIVVDPTTHVAYMPLTRVGQAFLYLILSPTR